MAILTAVLSKGSEFIGENPSLSTDGRVYAKVEWPFLVSGQFSSNLASALTRKLNVSVPARRDLPGAKSGSYLNDYWFRVHVAPSLIAFGDLVSNQTRNVEVWNANVTSTLLQSVTPFGNINGVTIVEPDAAPTSFTANESRIYQIGVTLNGSPTIDAGYTFVFTGQTSNVTITGRRVVLFPYKPNFKIPFTEALEWRTDVLRAFSGKEQRRGLSATPRRSFEFDIQVRGDETQYWQNLMWGWQERIFSVPVWSDASPLTENATAGNLTIQCKTANLSFVANGIAVIYLDQRHSEMVEIESFNATSITLKEPLGLNWSSGTHVYPCVFAHLPTEVNVTRHTSNVLTGRCVFKTSPDITSPFTPDTSAPTIYDGLEVITVQPNWANGLNQNLTHNFEEIDYGIGQIRWLKKETNPSKLMPYSWLLRDRAMIVAFRAFLGRQSGRLKTCWIPSWTDDFTAVLEIEASSTVLPVVENGFSRLVGVNPSNDRIAIRTKSGQVYYRRITAITLSPDGVNPALVLDSALGDHLLADDILTINMLHRCRFATDKFNFQWHTGSVVTVDSNFMTVDQ